MIVWAGHIYTCAGHYLDYFVDCSVCDSAFHSNRPIALHCSNSLCHSGAVVVDGVAAEGFVVVVVEEVDEEDSTRTIRVHLKL